MFPSQDKAFLGSTTRLWRALADQVLVHSRRAMILTDDPFELGGKQHGYMIVLNISDVPSGYDYLDVMEEAFHDVCPPERLILVDSQSITSPGADREVTLQIWHLDDKQIEEAAIVLAVNHALKIGPRPIPA